MGTGTDGGGGGGRRGGEGSVRWQASGHRYNFLKSIEDSEGEKSVQATIKILKKSDCSSDLNPFLTIIGGGSAEH